MSIPPSWMSKSYEGNNPSWKVKDINSTIVTKLEAEPVLSSVVASNDLQEKIKCPWCICPGQKAQRHNTKSKETEDTKVKNKNQITN